MDWISDLLKITLPAIIVLYAAYLMVKTLLNKEMERHYLMEQRNKGEKALPIRLQAYERMCLFLERSNPFNLVPRVNNGEYNARQLQYKLVEEIRNEFNHNLSQQVYMSHESWELIKSAMEEVIMDINQAISEVEEDEKGTVLAKRLFEIRMGRENDSISYALKEIKKEIQEVF